MTSSNRLTTGVGAGTPPLTHYFLLLRRNGRNARQRRGSKLKGACQGAPLNPMFMRCRACHSVGAR
jgi:hypothetical protein